MYGTTFGGSNIPSFILDFFSDLVELWKIPISEQSTHTSINCFVAYEAIIIRSRQIFRIVAATIQICACEETGHSPVTTKNNIQKVSAYLH